MKRRSWWIEIPNFNFLFNFKWQPVSYGIKFSDLEGSSIKQIVNHLEFHKEISTKSRFFQNMRSYWESTKYNVFDIMPLTFFVEIDVTKPNSKFTALSEFYNVYNTLEQSSKVIKKYDSENEYSDCNKHVKLINNELYKSLQGSKLSKDTSNISRFNSFTLNNKRTSAHTKMEMPLSHFSGNNFWILKATNLNRGRGIHVFKDLQSLHQLIDWYCKGVHSPTKISMNKVDQISDEKIEKRIFSEEKHLDSEESPQKTTSKLARKRQSPIK